ncbi:MAG: O-antigen ligase family protein [Patescibacteria group bacterium]
MNRQKATAFFKVIAYIGVYGGLLLPLMFIPVVIFPFVFSKLISFQILIGITFPSYAALAWMDPKYRPPKSMLYTAILAWFGAMLLSVIFAVDPNRAWWGNQERMNGLFTLLHFLAWLTMAIGLCKKWEDWKRLLNYEVILSVFMAIVAILQKPFPNILSFPAGDRVGGLLDNPIYMGAYQMFNMSFLALLFLRTKNKAARIWYVIVIAFDLVAFFLTQSRGAFFGLMAVIGSFALYYGFFTASKKARWGILGSAAAIFLSYGVVYYFRASEFVQHSVLIRLTNLQATTTTRLMAWEIAWKGFLQRPLTGWGLDDFFILFNSKYNPRSLEFGYYETWFDRAHNTIMDVISMTGIFGLIAYLSIFVTLFILVWKARKKGWIDLPIAAILTALPVGYFLQNLFVFDHPAAFSMSYLLFAFVIAATRPTFAHQPDPNEKAAEPKSHPIPWTAFGILQLIFVVVVWRFSVLPFRASMLAIQSNNYLGAGQLDQGVDLMKQSLALSTLYDGEQQFLLTRDLVSFFEGGKMTQFPNWRAAYDYAKTVNDGYLSKHPKDTNALLVYARLLHVGFPAFPKDEMAAEAKHAEDIYLRALQTSPKRQQLKFALARLYAQLQMPDKALALLKEAANDDPNVGESWWYVGMYSRLDLHQEDEGTKAIVQAMKAKVPYALTGVSDALQAVDAARVQKDMDLMKTIYGKLSTLPGGSVDGYLAFAKEMEGGGLIDERNAILNALIQVDPTLEPKLDALRLGKVQTIDESIALAPVATSTGLASSTPPTPDSINDTSTQQLSTSNTQAAVQPSTQVATASAAGPRIGH